MRIGNELAGKQTVEKGDTVVPARVSDLCGTLETVLDRSSMSVVDRPVTQQRQLVYRGMEIRWPRYRVLRVHARSRHTRLASALVTAVSWNLKKLYDLHDKINAEFFGGKLGKIRMRLERRNKTKWGWYQHSANSKTGVPFAFERASIHIHKECFADEDRLLGVLVHEMIHQYQAEVLRVECDHGRTFKRLQRKAKRKYKVDI